MATKRFILSLLVMFLVGTTLVSAQKTRVTGEVTEAGMGPIAGVTVILQGSSTGTVTGFDGKYSLDVTKEGVLEFRFLGMETLIEPVKGRAVINVEMKNDAITMDEVVVVGYGTQTKRTVTASVASVKGDSFKDMPSPSAETALQGRAAGVSIITTSGAVGQAPIVRVRGVSSITSGTEPLYVVDGVPVQTGNVSYTGSINPLADINPADILSMDVLKDAAAAAMYGSRAANGVVLITTKKGQQEKAKISYNTWVGVTVPSKTVDVMNAQQYVDFKNLTVKNRYGTDERSLTSGYTSPYGNKAYNMWKLTDGSYVDTDWSKEVFQTGLQHSHAVSISGGTQRIQYYLSANYTDQSGVIKNDNYNRLGGAANVTAKATDWLKIGFNMNATNSGTKYSDKGRNGGVFATEGYTRLALILPPNMPAYNEDGTAYLGDGGAMGIAPNTVRVSGYPNPAALLENGSQVETDVARILSSYFAELTPIKNLTLKTQLGIDYMNVVDKRFNNPYMGDGYSTHGEAYSVQIKNKTLTWTVHVNEARHPLKNVTVTDILPKGLSIKAEDITVNGEKIDPKKVTIKENQDKTTTVTLALGDIGTKYAKIEYQTTITDFTVNEFKNSATLTGDGVGQGDHTTTKPIKPAGNAFSKTVGTVNYTDKTIEWKITVDPKREAIKALTITDTFPNKGLIMLNDSVKVTVGGKEKTKSVPVSLSDGAAAGGHFDRIIFVLWCEVAGIFKGRYTYEAVKAGFYIWDYSHRNDICYYVIRY